MTFYEASVDSDWPHNVCNSQHATYFDLISLSLSYLNFPHFHFLCRPGYLFNGLSCAECNIVSQFCKKFF